MRSVTRKQLLRQDRTVYPSRRDALRAMGLAAGIPIVGRSVVWGQPACAVLGSPSLTEGPYFVDEDLNRNDIRVDPADGTVQPGLPLALSINVAQLVNCNTVPLTGAYVDIWHCNAAGVYSDVAAQNTTGRKFLRGYQPTDRQGNAQLKNPQPGT